MNIVEPLFNTHTHLRELLDVMQELIALAIKGGADALLPMPNTAEGLRTREQVLQYIRQAQSLIPAGQTLHFIPTLMITEETTEDEIRRCAGAGINDCKVYPRDRTTKSHNGVRDYASLISKVKTCGEVGMNVHLHPEHPWLLIGNRDAEYFFLSIAEMFLRATNAVLIWEHGTDARCIPAWKEMAKSNRFFLTLTAHHLAWNEDQVYGDVRNTCKPPFKTEQDRAGLIQLVQEDLGWVMAGGDDAPHPDDAKHVHSGQCACGAYTAPFLLQLYAHALDPLTQSDAGRRIFGNFTSCNARKFYNRPPVPPSRLLTRQEFVIPDYYQVGPWKVEPAGAGRQILYSIQG